MKHSILLAAVLFTVPTFAMAQPNNTHINDHHISNHQTSNHSDMRKSELHHSIKRDCNHEMQGGMKRNHSNQKMHEEMSKMHSNSNSNSKGHHTN